jgi:hypothetical protein
MSLGGPVSGATFLPVIRTLAAEKIGSEAGKASLPADGCAKAVAAAQNRPSQQSWWYLSC